MMRRLAHLFLVLTFALLQCVSPLVHAHVDGDHTGIMHAPAAAQAYLSDEGTIVTTDEPTVISLSDDIHKFNHVALPAARLSPVHVASPFRVAKRLSFAARVSIVHPAYSKSHPQAPPVLS